MAVEVRSGRVAPGTSGVSQLRDYGVGESYHGSPEHGASACALSDDKSDCTASSARTSFGLAERSRRSTVEARRCRRPLRTKYWRQVDAARPLVDFAKGRSSSKEPRDHRACGGMRDSSSSRLSLEHADVIARRAYNSSGTHDSNGQSQKLARSAFSFLDVDCDGRRDGRSASGTSTSIRLDVGCRRAGWSRSAWSFHMPRTPSSAARQSTGASVASAADLGRKARPSRLDRRSSNPQWRPRSKRQRATPIAHPASTRNGGAMRRSVLVRRRRASISRRCPSIRSSGRVWSL